MKLLLIRHGMTKGNKEHRYLGSTDEGLLAEERERLLTLAKTGRYAVDRVFVSPMKRCIETAEILLTCNVKRPFDSEVILEDKSSQGEGITSGGLTSDNMKVVDAFREMNFGAFEYMTYQEINNHPNPEYKAAYQRYIDSNGETAFPGGESKAEFCDRVCNGFLEVLKTQLYKEKDNGASREETIALVVHGGTIMALLDRFSDPHKDYFEWNLKPGEAYEAKLMTDEGKVKILVPQKI